jgi:hypothetical protein
MAIAGRRDMKYHVYSKDEGGIMEYRGCQEWDSLALLLNNYCVDDYEPETVELQGA